MNKALKSNPRSQRAFTRLAILALGLLSAWPRSPLGGRLLAEETPPSVQEKTDKTEKEVSLVRMQAQAKRLIVKLPTETESRLCTLRETLLLHYSDRVRKLPESTLWMWELDGLPVLFSKVERMTNAAGNTTAWQYCCVPTTPLKADVEWEREFRWRARESTFQWTALIGTADPRDQASARLTQMKNIVREFSGETEQTPINSRQELRLLASPLHRFAAPVKNVLDGAVFGLTSNGTNPDVLLIVEALRDEESKSRWRYAVVGMTGDAVEVVHQKSKVWTKKFTDGPGDHRSWMWYISYR